MQIAELVHRSGVPLARVKFYIREGMLPAGSSTGARRAEYDESHLERLRLIRSLTAVAGLPLARAKQILGVIDHPEGSVSEMLARAIAALAAPDDRDALAAPDGRGALAAPDGRDALAAPDKRDALAAANDRDALAARDDRGTLAEPENEDAPAAPEVPVAAPAFPRATAALPALGATYASSRPDMTAFAQLESALRAAEEAGLPATPERLRLYGDHIAAIARVEIDSLPADPHAAIPYAVLGTAVYEPVLAALRRLAHQNLVSERHSG